MPIIIIEVLIGCVFVMKKIKYRFQSNTNFARFNNISQQQLQQQLLYVGYTFQQLCIIYDKDKIFILLHK